MKKTLTIVLALVLALSMIASMAFVLNPGTGSATAPTASGLVITGFFVTDDTAIVSGARVYTDLVNNTDKAYAKNEVIRFAVTGSVLNPAVIANNVAAVTGAELVFSSDTVDLSLSAYPGMVVLHKPFGSTLINAINAVPSDGTLKGGDYEDDPTAVDYGTLTTTISVNAANTGDASVLTVGGFELGTTFAPVTAAKYNFAYIFSGVTKGEVTEQGLVTMKTAKTASDTFNLPTDAVAVVTKNGRTYLVEKVTEAAATSLIVKHPTLSTVNATYYLLSKVGYRVYLATPDTNNSAVYDLTPIGQLDSESVTYNPSVYPTLDGKEVEGIGYSLGLETLAASDGLNDVDLSVAIPAAPADVNVTTERVFKTVLSNGTVRFVDGTGAAAFNATELSLLNTMLADFGFSTDVNYTYKLEDKYFTTSGDYASTLTASYNNGTVVPVESDEEPDVSESTPDEELPDESTIDESVDDEVIEDETPAETGDFSADVAIALAAAAVVAAAALAFVMKKVHD